MGAKAPRAAAGHALPSCKLARMFHGFASSLAGVSRGNRVLLGGLLLYGVALWVLRPLTPFEQDEVLFLRALEKYDVAKHAPHPPGYPLYIGIGKVLRALISDPVTALQLVSVAAAMAALLFAWLLARRAGATRGEATAAAMIIAAAPTWLFHAAVGFSDVPGTAVALAATWALLSALDRPTVLPLAGVAVAAAAAVRPQLLLVLFPLGVAVLVVTARRGRWTALASGAGSAIGVSLAAGCPRSSSPGRAAFGRRWWTRARGSPRKRRTGTSRRRRLRRWRTGGWSIRGAPWPWPERSGCWSWRGRLRSGDPAAAASLSWRRGPRGSTS